MIKRIFDKVIWHYKNIFVTWLSLSVIVTFVVCHWVIKTQYLYSDSDHSIIDILYISGNKRSGEIWNWGDNGLGSNVEWDKWIRPDNRSGEIIDRDRQLIRGYNGSEDIMDQGI